MVTRCTPLFMVSPTAQVTVAVIGGATAMLAGLIALTQFDLKRVLAYSTVSQLGFMFLGLGTGTLNGITAGMFHLFTHAFFKALLFLGSGSVMHAMGNVIDMRRFGGLRRLMPITHGTFLFGCLALAGVVPFAGFWSKDAILAALHTKGHGAGHAVHATEPAAGPHALSSVGETHLVAAPAAEATGNHGDGAASTESTGNVSTGNVSSVSAAGEQDYQHVYLWLYRLALVTAFLTAFYTFRAFFLTFYGEEVVPHEAHGHAHESPPAMWIPLTILAAFALVVGAFFEWTQGFAEFLRHTPSLAYGAVAAGGHEHVFHWDIAAISTVVAAAGIGVAAYFYLGTRSEVESLRGFFDLAWLPESDGIGVTDRWRQAAWVRGVDQLLGKVHLRIVGQLLGGLAVVLATVILFPLSCLRSLTPYRLSLGKFFIDEIYQAFVVWPVRALAAVCYFVDRWLVDGTVNLVGKLPGGIGWAARGLQGGLVSFYGLAMVLGLLSLIAARVVWGG